MNGARVTRVRVDSVWVGWGKIGHHVWVSSWRVEERVVCWRRRSSVHGGQFDVRVVVDRIVEFNVVAGGHALLYGMRQHRCQLREDNGIYGKAREGRGLPAEVLPQVFVGFRLGCLVGGV